MAKVFPELTCCRRVKDTDTVNSDSLNTDFQQQGNIAQILLQYLKGVYDAKSKDLTHEQLLALDQYIKCCTRDAVKKRLVEYVETQVETTDKKIAAAKKYTETDEQFAKKYHEATQRASLLANWPTAKVAQGSLERSMALTHHTLEKYSLCMDNGKKYHDLRLQKDPEYVPGRAGDVYYEATQLDTPADHAKVLVNLSVDGMMRASGTKGVMYTDQMTLAGGAAADDEGPA